MGTHTHTQTGGKRIQFITNNDLVTIRICEHPSGNIHPTSTTIDDDEDGHINSESSLLNIVCCLMMIVIVDLEEKRKYTTQRAHTHTHILSRDTTGEENPHETITECDICPDG